MWGLLVSLGVWEVSVGVRQGFSESSCEGSSGLNCLEVFFLDFLKVEVVHEESGGDDVILVDGLDESLDSGSLDEFFFINASLDGSGVSGDTDDG